MKARFVYENTTVEYPIKTIEKDGVTIAYIPKEEINEVCYIDFAYDYFNAKTGDKGYFISDFGIDGTFLTKFTPREDSSSSSDFCFLGCYGWNRGESGILAIVTGMRCDFGTELGVKNGIYYLYPRFYIDKDKPYEDIKVEFYHLKDGSYSSMARKYREYQLDRGGCVPLKERIAADDRLFNAMERISVRVRQAWKPAPSPVENQTLETEPPLHVACTFDRAGEIAGALKSAGVEKAEFCLVGWNIGGHDGRFPQIFPVEPQLGGEERLKVLIQKLKGMRYGIVCHDDATAAYTIADCFDEEYLLKERSGEVHKRNYCWSGGRPHKICPKRQYEKFELKNQEQIKNLGFEGLHYIDVMTILPLLKCYDERHPVTKGEAAQWYRKIMRLARKNFGGFSSESGYDYAASDTDFILYASFRCEPDETTPLCDKSVPFWQIAYHGIIMYNPNTFTLNYTAKQTKNRLKYIELGGRPLVCCYANFTSDQHWMGYEDFIFDTDEQMRDCAEKIKIMYDDYQLFKDERYEYIDSHEEIAENVFRTVYSNGTAVTVDYNNETFRIEKNTHFAE